MPSVLLALLPLTVLVVLAAVRWQNLAKDTRSVDAYGEVLKRLAVAADMAPTKRRRKRRPSLLVPRTHVHVLPEEVAPLRPHRSARRARKAS